MRGPLPVNAPTARDAFQPKLIYLARRNPALSRRDFVARWRQHGALGMSLPRWRNVARYVHCDVLDPPSPTPAIDASHDAIGIVWHRSPAARAAHLADTGSRLQMEQDERETFAQPIVETCVLTREHVLLAPPDPASAATFKLMRFLQVGADPSTLAQITASGDMASRHRALAAAGAPVRGHLVDLPLPPERGATWGLACAVIEELWFDDLASATAAGRWFAAATRVPPIRAATMAILTNEVLLYSI